MNGSEKLVIIGLDGGTFRVLRPLAKSGVMPMLGRMLREGAHGNLMTTRPPVTCPAWPTMWTGVNPGKHGVFSFSYRDPRTHEVRTASANDVHAPRIWEIAGDDGKRVGIFNVPITFPASKINGEMLTGFVSPDDSPQVFWPGSFGKEMRSQFPELSLTWGVLGHRPPDAARREAHIREINELMDLRCRQFEWAVGRADYDFCFLVHEYTDRIGHLFQHLLDADYEDSRRASNAGSRSLLEEGHRILDDSIARLVSRFGVRTNFMLVSDHGFGGVTRWVYINNLLESHGLLRLRKFRTWADVITRQFHIPVAVRRGLGLEQDAAWHKQDPGRNPLIDYRNSQAYAGPQLEHSVYISAAGRGHSDVRGSLREYEQVRQRTIDVLSSAVDPESGDKVFEGVWAREEIYNGPFVKDAPDIIYELAPGYMTSNAIVPPRLLKGGFLRPLRAGWDVSGYHRPEGIFIGWGPAFKAGDIGSANILDIAPTALYLMGLPIPSYMDGRVTHNAIQPERLSNAPPEYVDRELAEADSTADAFTDEERLEVTRRLEELGYL